MILHPPVVALLAGSVLVGLVLLHASRFAVQILRRWDLASGSELQLALERKTYLITTVLFWAFLFQLGSLFLFVYVADDLSKLFVGAMCAAGSLALNRWGYAALLVKVFNFLLAGVWLVVNHADNRSPAYPLVRPKYLLLLLLTPSMLAEAALQGLYFLSLKPNVITSCCGSLFSEGGRGLPALLSSFPRPAMEASFGVAMLLTFALGGWFLARGSRAAGSLFSLSGAATLAVSVAAFLSYQCLYFYELPTHHCPFCVFQAGYWYVGYPLYLSLLAGAVPALGVGALLPYQRASGLADVLPVFLRKLAAASLLSYGVFAAIVFCRAAVSDLRF
ncbi:MAG: hypothetical protein HZB55_05995 [Deltaproteobacteria bacterium]|nr:hypothetical protein [Deltaproteobacteria bacterium]